MKFKSRSNIDGRKKRSRKAAAPDQYVLFAKPSAEPVVCAYAQVLPSKGAKISRHCRNACWSRTHRHSRKCFLIKGKKKNSNNKKKNGSKTLWRRTQQPKRINSDQFNVSRLMMSFAEGFCLQFLHFFYCDTFCRNSANIVGKIFRHTYIHTCLMVLRILILETNAHTHTYKQKQKEFLSFLRSLRRNSSRVSSSQ